MVYKSLFIIALLLFISSSGYATHLRAGEIRVEQSTCDDRTVVIRIVAYIDMDSPAKFGEGILTFGDGNQLILPQIDATPLPGYPGIGLAEFSVEHTYSVPGYYRIGYSEANRNPGIVNMDNPVITSFYIQAETIINSSGMCNSSPVLTVPPVDFACTDQLFSHIPGAVDPDGDSLVFQLVIPRKSADEVVDNYRDLLEFSSQNEVGGEPEFIINSQNGLLTWDSPGMPGEYVIALRVDEYRDIGDSVVLVGSTVRDMEILVSDCDGRRPVIYPAVETCFFTDEGFTHDLFVYDADGDNVTIEFYGELEADDQLVISAPTQVNPQLVKYTVSWQPGCGMVRDAPYNIFLKAIETESPRLASFVLWETGVKARPPDILSADLDPAGLTLTWEEYTECENMEKIEIYRKVGHDAVNAETCDYGIRSVYEKIGETGPSDTAFLDNALIPAATLCYRIIAVLENGARSNQSLEICYDFIPPTRPVITNVSVEKTDSENGEIAIAFREPSALNPGDRPWTYIAERLEAGSFIPVDTLVQATYTADSLGFRDIGLNTRDQAITYRVRMEIPDRTVVDYSENATSVWLNLTSLTDTIRLDWSFDVPWSNEVAGYDHSIYRGYIDEQTYLTRIDPVDAGFVFDDTDEIEIDRIYCYQVVTRGNYGNDVIPGPFVNYSQVNCTTPNDENPPSVVNILSEPPDCTTLFASENYPQSNQITWEAGDPDTYIYEVYFRENLSGAFNLLGTTAGTTFIHQREGEGPVVSLKGCYQVRAVDYSGNRGEFSSEYCLDNCVQFVLPNVFTPNQDGCNDAFRVLTSGSISGSCNSVSDPFLYSRYVEGFTIHIFNRWGQLVYSENSADPEEFSWQGLDAANRKVPGGIYYYRADVNFDKLQPGGMTSYTGWVQVLR